MSDVKELIDRLLDYHAHDMSDELAADAATALKRLSAEKDAAREALRHLSGVAENFMWRFNVHDLPESDAQQWQALEHEIARARAALEAEPVESKPSL
jgi:hypothetical protein